MKTFVIVAGVLGLLLLGYAGYTAVVQDPPDALVDVVTQTDPPPALPEGQQAPLVALEGFEVTIFSRETPGVRVLALDDRGTMLASLTQSGRIVALPNRDGDGEADEVITILEGLQQPHGILVWCTDENGAPDDCKLYVAETHMVSSYDYNSSTYQATNREELVDLPSGDGHYTRTLMMHPDGQRILISVGSSCNVCVEEDERRAAVLSLHVSTGEVETFATGLRNTVFMATDPVMGEVWGTDNGRDMIGDDIPPDEVNILTEGNDYGWPYCYGQNVRDTTFDASRDTGCEGATPAHIDLQAHSAALGLAFIPESGWPEEMWHDLLIAYHGSWNRSTPTGYKVVRFDLDSGSARLSDGVANDFLTGFLETNDSDDAIGRPVAVMTQPGGVAYISDDRAGAIYRVAYTLMQ